MKYQHTVVWIDHRKATVMHLALLAPALIEGDAHDLASMGAEATVIQSETAQHKLHLKAGVRGDGRAPVDQRFFDDVAAQMQAAKELLIVGPGSAKTEFGHHLERRHPQVWGRVVGVETVDHPTERELLDFARRSFQRIDSLRGGPR